MRSIERYDNSNKIRRAIPIFNLCPAWARTRERAENGRLARKREKNPICSFFNYQSKYNQRKIVGAPASGLRAGRLRLFTNRARGSLNRPTNRKPLCRLKNKYPSQSSLNSRSTRRSTPSCARSSASSFPTGSRSSGRAGPGTTPSRSLPCSQPIRTARSPGTSPLSSARSRPSGTAGIRSPACRASRSRPAGAAKGSRANSLTWRSTNRAESDTSTPFCSAASRSCNSTAGSAGSSRTTR